MYVKPENDKTWQVMLLVGVLCVAIYPAYQLYEGLSTGEILLTSKYGTNGRFVSYQSSPISFVTASAFYISLIVGCGGAALLIIRRIRRLMTKE
jgi:hypothetical protein